MARKEFIKLINERLDDDEVIDDSDPMAYIYLRLRMRMFI